MTTESEPQPGRLPALPPREGEPLDGDHYDEEWALANINYGGTMTSSDAQTGRCGPHGCEICRSDAEQINVDTLTPWRVGRKVGRTIYDAHDQLIGVMDDAKQAARVVEAVNGGGPMPDAGREATRPGAGVLSFRGAPVGAVQGGCLCFEGTRIPVEMIVGFMEAGDSDEAILDAYPSLTQVDLDAARWFTGKWEVFRV